ncbi:histidine phosphatase family protein [Chloroflexota bacterium]
MTTTILVARHGQTNSNITGFYMGRSNEDLTEVGYTQAQRLSSRLACLPIASVYTSPLRRAYATATILAEPHKLEPRVMEELIEIHLGDWQGLHMDEIRQRWPEVWRNWKSNPAGVIIPNGESLAEVAERAIKAFRSIVNANHGKRAAIVAHEAIAKMLVAHALQAPNSIYRRFEIGNASLSVIRVTNNNFRLERLNDTSHLEDGGLAT